jgi:hypothetical protein
MTDTPKPTGEDLYNKYINNHPTIHTNRFPTWKELDKEKREYYNSKAKR